MTESNISLSDVQLFNFIVVKDDPVTKANLFNTCSQYTTFIDDQGIERDNVFEIAKIKIKAFSLFPNGQTFDNDNTITLKILTQNQGIAIVPREGYTKELYFSYGS